MKLQPLLKFVMGEEGTALPELGLFPYSEHTTQQSQPPPAHHTPSLIGSGTSFFLSAPQAMSTHPKALENSGSD